MIREILNFIRSMFTWFVIVLPWEQGIRVRLGKTVKRLDMGWHICIPFIDQFYKQSIRRRSCMVPAMTLTTKDKITLTVSGYIWYEIKDIYVLYNSLHDAQDTIESEIAGLVSEYIISHDFESCDAESIIKEVQTKNHLSKYGLGAFDFAIANHAKHRTVRLITGEIRYWNGSDKLKTYNDQPSGVR